MLLRAVSAAARHLAAEEDRAFPARDDLAVRFLDYDWSLDDAARR